MAFVSFRNCQFVILNSLNSNYVYALHIRKLYINVFLTVYNLLEFISKNCKSMLIYYFISFFMQEKNSIEGEFKNIYYYARYK